MGGIGFPELLILLLVLLLLFGSTRLPKLARSIGQASKEFKRGAAQTDGPAASGDQQLTVPATDLHAILAERDAQESGAGPAGEGSPIA
jgi:sec-independent protein translocase protein TatA